MFSCKICSKSFSQKGSLNRHVLSAHNNQSFICEVCGSSFLRKDYLISHRKAHTNRKAAFSPARSSTPDLSTPSSSNTSEPPAKKSKRYTNSASALNKNVEVFDISEGVSHLHVDMFLEAHRSEIIELIQDAILDRKGVKWFLSCKIRFVRQESWIKDRIKETEAYFQSGTFIGLLSTDVNSDFDTALGKMLENTLKFIREGSGWKFDSVLFAKLTVATYSPLSASSYVPLPPKLKNTHSVINIKNEDQLCFLWCVLAFLHPAEKNPNRVSKYSSYENELNVTGIDFPVSLTQVRKFAIQNNLSINVYGYSEKEDIFPLLISDSICERHIDLLLISDEDTKHFCLIKNMDKLLCHFSKHKAASFHCRRCLHRFSRADLLEKHTPMCIMHTPCKTVLPPDGANTLKFSNFKNMLPANYIIYSDFEAFCTKIQGPLPNKEYSHTTPTALHVPCGFCIVVISPDGSFFREPIIYRGDNVIDTFFEKLLELQTVITPFLKECYPLIMTDEDEENFKTATHCHICLKPFTEEDVMVRDHDHRLNARNFRGSAHASCNLQMRVTDIIPVVFHNLSNYDIHFLMQGVGKIKDQELRVIPNNSENYVSFSIGNLRFIDSYRFLPASLETLVNNLAKEGASAFNCVTSYFPEDKINILLRKGVFAYSFLENEECFNLTELPPREAFYNDLSQSHISDDDYLHAINVWQKFAMTNFGQYFDLYLALDTLLLADVFQNFRKVALEYYRLDPANYYTTPGLTLDACLLKTGIHLELLSDVDMYLFIEKGVRGGVTMVSHRYCKANNPYIEGYDNTKPITFINLWDVNNLYGYSMTEYLPIGGFKWVENLDSLDITAIPDDSEYGYFLEVDLEYPEDLHNIHNDYPLAPETMVISDNMLSSYSKNLLNTLGMKHLSNVKKLVPNLSSKKNYVLHFRNLKLYLSLGLKLTKIHKALEFKQSPWLKPYVEFNSEKRKMATSDFEKDFFKLLVNSLFGKFLESPRKRVEIKLVHTAKRLKNLIAKPEFKSCKVFSEDLVAVELHKTTLNLNKPVYVGQSILDLSKHQMYDFHYNYMLKKYGEKCIMAYTDTDSFVYLTQTDNIYDDMLSDIHRFDTSDYPPEHFLHSLVNKKRPGVMKDEVPTGFIKEFVGLRPKTYSLLTTDTNKKRAKGVNKSTTKQFLTHEKYKSCLFNRDIIIAEMNRINSQSHQIYTVNTSKIALNPADDKRFLLDDGISTLAHGHFSIETDTR